LGPPQPRDLIWPLFGIPLFLGQIALAVARLLDGLTGGPLVVSKMLGLSATWTGNPLGFVSAVAFYAILITFAAMMLWGACLWAQHWLYYRRRKPAG
jgi:uncharacterized membrane protein YhaH (DUF805 family)